jgi:acetyl-CoA carboxylase biotin carboxyl carrier protein
MPPRGKTKTTSPPSTSTSAVRRTGESTHNEAMVETVRGLAAILAEHGLSEVIVDLPDATLTLRRGVTASVASVLVPAPASAPPPPAGPVAAPPPAAAPAPAPAVDDKAHVVTSPFVGTFYRKPNPDSAVYVQLGDKVAKGQVLCIVEAMKLMNEIEADVAGTVVAILAEDGSVVEYGQPLFKIST